MAERTKPARRYRQFTDRRLEILRSATAAFTRNGFAGATMEEIAEQVHMAKGNLYYYFPSKQDLLYFCQEQSLNLMLEQVRQIVDSGAPADVQLQRMIAVHVKTILEVMPGSTAHTDFRLLPPGQLRKVIRKRDQYERAYRRVISRGIRAGVFRRCNARAATWAILGALNWTVQWFSPTGALTVDALAAEFGDLFLHALRPQSQDSTA